MLALPFTKGECISSLMVTVVWGLADCEPGVKWEEMDQFVVRPAQRWGL